jgi:hypothetical protein
MGMGNFADTYWRDIVQTQYYQDTTPNSKVYGSALDLRSATAPAKIITWGMGTLYLENLMLIDRGWDDNYFIYTSNTRVLLSDLILSGSGYDSSAHNGGIRLGGPVLGWPITAVGCGDDPSVGSLCGYQGYGSKLSRIFFDRTRVSLRLGVFTNSLLTEYLQWAATNKNPNGPAIDAMDCVGLVCTGNTFLGSFNGSYDYKYHVKGSTFSENNFIGESIDGNLGSLQEPYYLDNSFANNIIPGFMSNIGPFPLYAGNTALSGLNSVTGNLGAFQSRQLLVGQSIHGSPSAVSMYSDLSYWYPQWQFQRYSATSPNYSDNGYGGGRLSFNYFSNYDALRQLNAIHSTQTSAWNAGEATSDIQFKFRHTDGTDNSTKVAFHSDSSITQLGVLYGVLGTPANGTIVYCSDCAIANPCTGSGTGALAKRLNGAWVCN